MNKDLLKFNLNGYIHFHLDANGKKILSDHYQGADCDIWKSDMKDGYFKMQAWEFIDVFGGKSCGCYAPYSTEVFLEQN